MSSAAKNLEAICAAMDRHAKNCPFPLREIKMCDFELERLGWDEIRGVPVTGDPDLGSGRFRLVCGGQKDPSELSEPVTDAVSRDRDLVTA